MILAPGGCSRRRYARGGPKSAGRGPVARLAIACCALLAACAGHPGSELAEVWRLRDQRRGRARLVELLAADHGEVRRRAAHALGALGDPAAIGPLLRAADDPDPWVRYAAVFALGQLDDGGREFVVPLAGMTDEGLRLLAIRGLWRPTDARHWQIAAAALDDPSPRVRGAAALALIRIVGNRLRGQESAVPEPARVQVRDRLLRRLDAESDAAIVWQLVYAVAGLVEPTARSALLRAAGTRESAAEEGRWARAFAIRGLGALPSDVATAAALRAAATDEDALIAHEAVAALARRATDDPDPAATAATLRRAATARHPAVRAAALTALAEAGGAHGVFAGAFDAGEPSATVRAAALEAAARTDPEGSLALVERAVADPDWRLRAAGARAARHTGPAAAAVLRSAAADPDVRVRTAALETCGALQPTPPVEAIVRELARERDAALRETLAGTLAAWADPRFGSWLLEALADSPGPELAEARRHLARVAREIGFEPRPLAEPAAEEGETETPELGVDVPFDFLTSRPVVELDTERGTIAIALQPAHAPLHCWSLCRLVAAGSYDGRSIHRVVPGFVVQGGDARGDGYANTAWNGETLRDEINPLRFVGGIVGMPKTDEPHSGGDQFFITLLPAPHLDGRYTAFAAVIEGMDVVERLEVGDVIVRARLRDPAPSAR